MAFLDDLGRTLADMGKDTVQKTKNVVDILQTEAQIGTEKLKLRDLYVTVGKSHYEVHKDPAEVEHAEAYGQIESSLAKIVELEEKISRLGNTVTCPSCGAVLDRGPAFYNRCGVTVVSSSQDLMVVGKDAPDEADNVVVEDVERDVKKTTGDIIVEEAERTEEQQNRLITRR